MRKVVGKDAGTLYAMKVLKKATLKSESNFLNIVTMFGVLSDPLPL